MKKMSLMIVMMLTFAAFGTTIYVNDNAAGLNNGTSWANSFTQLQPALDAAVSGDEIWVAEGTYKPTYDYGLGIGVRGNHFRLKNGVQVLGGFNGTETDLSQRRPLGYNTFLSGDIGISEYSADNCYSVFYHPAGCDLDSTAVLDGFKVVWGNADHYSAERRRGAGMYNFNSSPTIRNVFFILNIAYNNGGAVYNTDNSSPVFNRCTFSNNTAQNGAGGAICNMNYSSPEFDACMFNSNTAGFAGGAIYSDNYCEPILYNSILVQNSSGSFAGGIESSYHAVTTLINCNVAFNTAVLAGGIYCDDTAVINIYNSIVWGNTAPNGNEIGLSNGTINIDHSCYGNDSNDIYNFGTLNATNSITSDPMFMEFNYGVGATDVYGSSPCVDAGLNSYNAKLLDYNLLGRIENGTIDMGAYEWRSPMLTNPTVFVNLNATGTGTGKNWTNACTTLQAALDLAGDKYHIWVAGGIYKPSYDYGLGLGSRGNHFRMKNGVGIYGGFNGTETLLSQRNFETNQTFLSGDIGTPISTADNCYHVFYHPDGLYLDNSAVLDGFTVRDGNAGGAAPHCYGGGIYNNGSSPAILNTNINYNTASSGGGVYNENSSAKYNICDISENTALVSGGGIYNSSSHLCDYTDSYINYNTAGYYGGGIYNYYTENTTARSFILFNTAVLGGGAVCNDNSITALSNNLIVNNSSTNEGGGIMNFGSQTVITNCTISGNSTQAFGGGIYSSSSSIDELRNTIVWNNSSAKGGNEIYVDQYSTSTLNYSCYGNDTGDIIDQDGNGFINSYANITDNPRLVNPAEFNFRIYGFSPCVNSGNDSYNVETMDVRDEARIQGGYIDMGAYEWTDGVDPANINAPLNVTIIVNGSGDREITWSSVYEAYEYYVYRFEQPYGVFKKIATTVSNMYIDSEMPSGNKYFYYVTADSGPKK